MKKIVLFTLVLLCVSLSLFLSASAESVLPYLDLSKIEFDSEGNAVSDENGEPVLYSLSYFEQYGVIVRSDKTAAVYGFESIIGDKSFDLLESYVSAVYFDDTLSEIMSESAMNFYGIKTIRIGNSLKKVGANAFKNTECEIIVEGENTDELLYIEYGNDCLLKKELFSVYNYVMCIDANGEKTLINCAQPYCGFYTISGKMSYYENGKPFTGSSLIVDGIKYWFDDDNCIITDGFASDENGEVYLVDSQAVKGFYSIEGKTCYFDEEGYLYQGSTLLQNGITYYFSAEHCLADGIITIDGGKTIVSGGVPLGRGFVEYNGKTYYISKVSGLLNEKTKLSIGGTEHFFNSDYSAKNGLFYENGATRLYENGKCVKGAWRDLDGDGTNDSYFLFSNGNRVLNERTIGGRAYAFEDGKLILKQGLRFESGKYYYYEAGIKVGGYVSIDGKKFYFLRSSYDMVTQATYIIGGYTREFNSDYSVKPLSGWQTVNGKRYYFEEGEMATGFRNIGGYTYYFIKSAESYGSMASGWITISGRVYYFFREGSEKYGRMVTGTQTISGRKYVFNTNGTINTGFVSDSSGQVRYYYQSQPLYGWYKIASNTYYFTLSQGFMAIGEKIIAGKFYFFDNNGVLLYPDYPDANELTGSSVSSGDTFDGSSGGWGAIIFQ